MPQYQLSLRPQQRPHGGFVYFSEGRPDGAAVVVTHRILPPRDRDAWCRRTVAHNGSDESLGRRTPGSTRGGGFGGDYSEVELEFMRYCVVWAPGDRDAPTHAVCMDTLCDVDWATVTEARMSRCDVGIVPSDVEVGRNGPVASFAGISDRAHRWRRITVATAAHGRLSVTLGVYRNPDVRNGISVCVARRPKPSTAYGAVVRAVAPRRLVVPRLSSRPPPLPPGMGSCEDVNRSDYYTLSECVSTIDHSTHNVLMPRGGRGRKSRVNLAEVPVEPSEAPVKAPAEASEAKA